MEEFDIIVEDEETIDISAELENDFLRGEKGEKGDSNTLTIGTVTKGEEASAEITGESPNQILNLVLPKGDKGEQGEQGIPGEKGADGQDGQNGQDGYTPIKGEDYFTEAEIQQIKSDILADISTFDLLVVESLPTDNIQEKTIYLVPNTETKENNVYDEYIYVNSTWEIIGSTAVDLTDYYNKTEVDNLLDDVGDTLPIGSIVDYEGDTVPEGYVEVEDFNNVNTKLDISKVINFTPQNATNYNNYGNCYYYKIGSKVHLHIGILLDNSTTTLIYTIPEGFRPYTPITSIGQGDNLDKYGIIAVNPNGAIYCLSTTKYLNVDIEYDVIG